MNVMTSLSKFFTQNNIRIWANYITLICFVISLYILRNKGKKVKWITRFIFAALFVIIGICGFYLS